MISKNLAKGEVAHPIVLGSLIALLIAISPYIFYLYDSFPEQSTWETTLFIFTSEQYDLNIAAWLFFQKFVPLYLLILWFFTCKHWWYHVLLIPIAMFIFQLIGVLNDNYAYVDEIEIYFLIPVMMVVVPLVYLVRIKLFDRVVHGIDLRKIDEELEKYDQLERELERESRFYQS